MPVALGFSSAPSRAHECSSPPFDDLNATDDPAAPCVIREPTAMPAPRPRFLSLPALSCTRSSTPQRRSGPPSAIQKPACVPVVFDLSICWSARCQRQFAVAAD
ncbi:hypothetical protein AURDEDRAFT_177007 [Auricularia subglabra TFB-10046 SS5]|uniref:Uncharacterized protein n=1 Tax=Auricularia subglabra (strain TFB-10046 / SS5) TaxID=717982 RepID=J0WNK3_AURST|nr:hypothetical protein AURDEDRAFT_177007 [Auricularia subglabra TFB-10046 SS5]